MRYSFESPLMMDSAGQGISLGTLFPSMSAYGEESPSKEVSASSTMGVPSPSVWPQTTKHPRIPIQASGTRLGHGTMTDCAAMAMAFKVACKILISSIVGASTIATAHRTLGDWTICWYNSSLTCSFVSCLESVMPGMVVGTMAAAATTGPARGPRPASSIPMQTQVVWLCCSRSCRVRGRASRVVVVVATALTERFRFFGTTEEGGESS